MKTIKRFLISIAIALVVAGATFLVAQARAHPSAGATPVQAQKQIECSVCHQKFTDALAAGTHGHSMSDAKFDQMWTDQGKPGACLVCHATGYDPATGSVQIDFCFVRRLSQSHPAQSYYQPVGQPGAGRPHQQPVRALPQRCPFRTGAMADQRALRSWNDLHGLP